MVNVNNQTIDRNSIHLEIWNHGNNYYDIYFSTQEGDLFGGDMISFIYSFNKVMTLASEFSKKAGGIKIVIKK